MAKARAQANERANAEASRSELQQAGEQIYHKKYPSQFEQIGDNTGGFGAAPFGMDIKTLDSEGDLKKAKLKNNNNNKGITDSRGRPMKLAPLKLAPVDD